MHKRYRIGSAITALVLCGTLFGTGAGRIDSHGHPYLESLDSQPGTATPLPLDAVGSQLRDSETTSRHGARAPLPGQVEGAGQVASAETGTAADPTGTTSVDSNPESSEVSPLATVATPPLVGTVLPNLPKGFALPDPSDVVPIIIPGIENFSTTDPDSPWVMVNKANILDPADYRPQEMRAANIPTMTPNNLLHPEAATALEALDKQVKADTGHSLVVLSGFRSHDYQVGLYSRYLRQHGQAYTDTISAKESYSEHQTGWAVDVGQVGNGCITTACYGDTATGKWIAEHAWKFGYIVRYPKAADETTGFRHEPWHLRYVGVELAEYMHTEQIATLEEALGFDPAPDYLSD